MPIVFAAVVPHAPLLHPPVAKEHQALLDVTRQQLRSLAEEMYAAQPDVLIVLTPHGPSAPDAFSADVDDQLTGNLKEFGDVATVVSAHGSPTMGHQLKVAAENHGMRVALQTWPELDYGTTVPLTFFLAGRPDLPVLPFAVGPQPTELIVRCGHMFRETMQSRAERFAIVASADFSRRPKSKTRSGSRPTSEERTISSAITGLDVSALTSLQPQANTCGYTPTLLLVSTLHGLSAKGSILGFEAPFAVGMLTASYRFGP